MNEAEGYPTQVPGLHDTHVPLPSGTQVQQGDRQSASEPSLGQSSVMCNKETSGTGRRDDQFHRQGPEEPPERVEETRGRAFQVEGIARAKAQRSERSTVFCRRRSQPNWRWGLLLNSGQQEDERRGLACATSGQVSNRK